MGLFGSGGEVSGYNCSQIEGLRGVIDDVACNSASRIVEILHSEIVVPMSNCWYAPEAIEFFEGFKAAVAASGEAIRAAFDGYRRSVQLAGENWAENTKGQAPVLAELSPIKLDLNISDISAENNGNVTLDEGQARSIAASLGEVEQDIKTELERLAGQLNAETAFIGHGQATALQDCFVRVSGALHLIFKFLTDDGGLATQINAAAQKYADVSTNISSGFSDADVG